MRNRNNLWKRVLSVTLTVLMLQSSAGWALASDHTYFQKEEQILFAKDCLTEVYGYTVEESDRFTFQQTEQDGIATVSYWLPDFPQWVYTCQFSLTDGSCMNNDTPFGSKFAGYPGENSVRYIITTLQEKGWLSKWNKEAREGFRALLEQEGVELTGALDKGLLSATYTAQEALEDFFFRCYGPQEEWPEAVTEWHQWLVETHQLSGQSSNVAQGVTRYKLEGFSQTPMVLTEFVEATPPELAEAFTHPKLEGWQVLSGVTEAYEESPWYDMSDLHGIGLVAFGREDERLLCMVTQKGTDDPWQLLPISKTFLPEGCQVIMSRNDTTSTHSVNDLQLSIETDTCENGLVEVYLYHRSEYDFRFQIRNISFTDPKTDDRYQCQPRDGRLIVKRTESSTGKQSTSTTSSPQLFSSEVGYVALATLMDTIKEPEKAVGYTMPYGYVITGEVHLRKDSSSHSKDLGMLNAGTMVRRVGMENGDPHTWVKGEIGLLKGYVSTSYTEDIPALYADALLPIAIATKDASLQGHTGWFAPEVATVNSGTSMHIIMEQGKWYYVCIPAHQPAGQYMDPAGTYGYIKADQVLVGSNVLQLEWQLMEMAE